MLLIEKNPDRGRSAPGSSPGVRLLVADACEVDVAAAAQLDEADVVVAVTGDDEDNLVISLLAKQEFAVPRVIARVNHPKNHWLFNETWGVDVAVSTPHLLSALVEEAVSVGVARAAPAVRGRQHPPGRGDARRTARRPPAPPIDGIGLPRARRVVAIVRDGHGRRARAATPSSSAGRRGACCS